MVTNSTPFFGLFPFRPVSDLKTEEYPPPPKSMVTGYAASSGGRLVG
jgi:hypothetical protein